MLSPIYTDAKSNHLRVFLLQFQRKKAKHHMVNGDCSGHTFTMWQNPI
jgi:hypothetical protein